MDERLSFPMHNLVVRRLHHPEQLPAEHTLQAALRGILGAKKNGTEWVPFFCTNR